MWYNTLHFIYIFFSDINECLTADRCDENADCVNTNGSFICTCRDGFTGDGTTCTGTHFNVSAIYLLSSFIPILNQCCTFLPMTFNKLTSVFYASVLLLIMNFVITLSK